MEVVEEKASLVLTICQLDLYCNDVHPLEYLRSVARHQRADVWSVAIEFVDLVGGWGLEGAELSVAARRLLHRRPDAAPLWWSAAQLVLAADPVNLAQQLRDDLLAPMQEVEHDGWRVEAAAAHGDRFLLINNEYNRFTEAQALDIPVMVNVPSGTRIPAQYVERVAQGVAARGDTAVECSAEGVTVIEGGRTAPFAAELLRQSAI